MRPVEEAGWRAENHTWQMISTDPEDYGIAYEEAQRETLCGRIAAIDSEWYGGTQEFQEILTKLAEAYPGGMKGSVVQSNKCEEN